MQEINVDKNYDQSYLIKKEKALIALFKGKHAHIHGRLFINMTENKVKVLADYRELGTKLNKVSIEDSFSNEEIDEYIKKEFNCEHKNN